MNDASQDEDDEEDEDAAQNGDGSEDEDDDRKRIPPELLTRILHEFFPSDGTRVTRDANEAVAKYMDIFVREAIARAAAERRGGGFLEVGIPTCLFEVGWWLGLVGWWPSRCLGSY